MNPSYKVKNTKLRLNLILIICIVLSTFFLSIGYAAINPISLDIKGKAVANVQDGVFITDIKLIDSKNINKVNTNITDVYKTMVHFNVALSNITIDTYAKYEVTVYNNTNFNYGFDEANYDGYYTNSNIRFYLEGIQEGDVVNSGGYKTFYITFRYNTNRVPTITNLEAYIDFVFKRAHKITYENISNTNLPSSAITGENISISFGSLDAPIEVKLNGEILNSSEYTYSNYTLTLYNVSGDIHIRKLSEFTITNMITNSSFENGFTGWTFSGDSSRLGIAAIPYHGSSAAYRYPSAVAKNFMRQNIYWNANHKYYYFGHGISVTPQVFAANITDKGGKFTVTTNPSYYVRGATIYTADFTGYNTISVNYAEITDSLNIDALGLVDLTAAFGAGNEPDLEWCNANITYFPTTLTVYK